MAPPTLKSPIKAMKDFHVNNFPLKPTICESSVTVLKDLATESLHDSLDLKISPHTQQEAPRPQPANMSSKQTERSKR